MIDRILALFNGAESLSRVDIAQGLAVPESALSEPLAQLESTGRIVRVVSGALRWRRGVADDETQLMRLSVAKARAGAAGFTESEAFALLGADTSEDREAVRALLQSMVHRRKLQPTNRGWMHVRPAQASTAGVT